MFAHPGFVEAIGRAFSHPVRLAAIEDGNGWQAAVPVFEKRRGPFKASALPHVTPILSPLLRGSIHETEINHQRSALDVLLRSLADTYDQATLQLHSSIVDARPFAWSGWTVTPRYTHVANLAVDDPVAGWSKSVRYTIRTEAENYLIEENSQHTEMGIALMAASYSRKEKVLGLANRTLASLAHELVEQGLVRVFAATRRASSSPEAVALIAHDGRSAHYWIAGSKPGPAMGVLLAGVVPKLKQDGIQSLDFTGANVPSVAEFKRKYGAELQTYFVARRVSHPVLRVLDRFRFAR